MLKVVVNTYGSYGFGYLHTGKMAAVGTLVAGVAHEILNPLNILSMKVQFLRDRILTDDPEEISESFLDMRKQIDRIADLTENLLDFSRQREPSLAELDVRELLNQVISLVDYEYKLLNVKIKKNYIGQVPMVMADKDRLGQVFLNLITNSKDAMPKGGEISITVRPVRKQEKPWIQILFEDTGTGIPEHIVKRVFDPFFTTKAEGKGTGLGLSISYGIIQQHGGMVTLESTEPGGTTFLVELPAQEAETANDSTGESAGR